MASDSENEGGEWVRLVECAREAGVNQKVLRQNVYAGRIPVRVQRLTPRGTRLHRADWERWLQAATANTELADSA